MDYEQATTYLEYDLEALRHNVLEFKKTIQHPKVKLVGMVKANAYGSNQNVLANELIKNNIDFLGVATTKEGIKLRESNISHPVLVTLPHPWEAQEVIYNDLTPIVGNKELLRNLNEASNKISKYKYHLEIDTGFHRSGFEMQEAESIIKDPSRYPNLELEGLMMHFSCADESEKDKYNQMQLERFKQIKKLANENGVNPICHAANTAATIRFPDSHFDMVRIGLGLHGLHPSNETVNLIKLRPTTKLISRIVQIVKVPKGESVGYGASFTASNESTHVAVIPVGYHDGLIRSLSNKIQVKIGDNFFDSVGRISMDSFTVNIKNTSEVSIGDYVEVLDSNYPEISFDSDASKANTISYELISNIGERIPRIFIN